MNKVYCVNISTRIETFPFYLFGFIAIHSERYLC